MPISSELLHPLISVIVPCYNAAPFVAETIESVLRQTHPCVEVIVVDDASTDGSWEVVQSYRDQITAFRLDENRGGSHARNRGAEIARGEYLMFLDADDVLAPDTLAGLVAALHERDADIAGCRWRRLKSIDGRWHTVPSGITPPNPTKDSLPGWMTGESWFPPCAVLWRRQVYDKVGRWDEDITLNDDGDLMMRALSDGARLVVAEQGEGFYRSHGEDRLSVSTDLSAAKLRSQRRVIEKLEAKLTAQGRLPEYAEPLGVAYQSLALLALQNDQTEIARECQRHGESLAGYRPVSRTLPGRLLSRLVGVERKEQIAAAFARFGLATSERRRLRTLKARRTSWEAAGKCD